MSYKKKSMYIYGLVIFLFLVSLIFTTLFQLNTPYSSSAFLEYQVAPVYSKISGNVDKIFVKDGDYVEFNQPLFSINKKIYEAKYTSALGEFKAMKDSINSLKINIKKAKDIILDNTDIYNRNQRELNKFKKLYDKRFISEYDYDNMKIKVIESEKVLRDSKAQLKNLLATYRKDEEAISSFLKAKGVLEQAKLNLDYTVVKAPINGKVVIKNFYTDSSVSSGRTLFYIRNNENLKLKVDIKEKSIGTNLVGRKALIIFDGIPGDIYPGTVKRILPVLSDGYISADALPKVVVSNRWIRENGTIRICVDVKYTKRIGNLTSGSKASVVILSDNMLANFFARIWLYVIKVFNYVY